MKDTQIEWIGQIPDDWEVKRFKYIHSGTNVGESIDKEFWSQDENEYVFYTAGETNIYNTYNKFPNWKFVKSCDLLLARNGTPYVYLPPVDAQYSDHIIRTSINKDIDKRFVRYCLQLSIENEKVEVVSLATWSVSIWNEQKLPLPNITEQKLIADFLDKQTAKIDAIIKTNEEQLEVLKKYKKSLITQTVTKGLNKNARMKDSGISTLQEIPDNWDISKLKYEFSIVCGATPDSTNMEFWDGDINWIGPADMSDTGSISHGANYITKKGYNSCGTTLLPENSIIVSTRAPIGKVNIASSELCTNQGCKSLVANSEKNNNKYVYYYLISIKQELINAGRGATFKELSTFDFGNFYIPLPPTEEQNQIVKYLDEKFIKIDSLISQKQQAIETMQKYKKSLIYEYVTGKKRIK